MLKTLLRKTTSFFKHLGNGTANQRIKFLLRKWRSDNFWLEYPGLGGSFVHQLEEGVLLRLYRDDRLSELIYKEDFEINERTYVCHYLKSGMIFLDVGANIGLYSLIAAKLVGPYGYVYALEPASKTYRRLLDNIRLNKFRNIKTRQIALSDQNETRDMLTYARMYNAWNSLGGQIISDQRVRKERVECVCMDRFLSETEIKDRVSLIKIDVEGWESYVLRGGMHTLQSTGAPDMLIEFSDSNMETAGTSAEEVYSLLKDYGYALFRIDSTRKRLISEPFGDYHPYDNYFVTQNLARALELTGYTYETL